MNCSAACFRYEKGGAVGLRKGRCGGHFVNPCFVPPTVLGRYNIIPTLGRDLPSLFSEEHNLNEQSMRSILLQQEKDERNIVI